ACEVAVRAASVPGHPSLFGSKRDATVDYAHLATDRDCSRLRIPSSPASVFYRALPTEAYRLYLAGCVRDDSDAALPPHRGRPAGTPAPGRRSRGGAGYP